MTLRLKAQILSHSITTTDLEEPCEAINCLRPSTVRPRRRMPRTVGIRGSSQPSTMPYHKKQNRYSQNKARSEERRVGKEYTSSRQANLRKLNTQRTITNTHI